MNFNYATLCFINIGMFCHFQKMQSADIYIIPGNVDISNYINVNILLLILKNYSMENIHVTIVIKG